VIRGWVDGLERLLFSVFCINPAFHCHSKAFIVANKPKPKAIIANIGCNLITNNIYGTINIVVKNVKM
jgi:hypothetical protein